MQEWGAVLALPAAGETLEKPWGFVDQLVVVFDGDHSKLGAQQAIDDSVGAAVQHQEDVVEVAYYQGPQRKRLEFNKKEKERVGLVCLQLICGLIE